MASGKRKEREDSLAMASETSPKLLKKDLICRSQTSDSGRESTVRLDSGQDILWNVFRDTLQPSAHSTPTSSPKSSGYNSQSFESEESNSTSEPLEESEKVLKKEKTDAIDEDEDSWDPPVVFDPKKPYRDEQSYFPQDCSLIVPIVVDYRLYIPERRLPKDFRRKRVSLSPEIKPKVSKRTGKPKKNPQFMGPDSESEVSD